MKNNLEPKGFPLFLNEALKKMGFRVDAVIVLEDLVKNKKGTITKISKRVFMARSSVEKIMQDLFRFRMVQKREIEGIDVFSLVSKKKIMDFFREKQAREYEFYEHLCVNIEEFLEIDKN